MIPKSSDALVNDVVALAEEMPIDLAEFAETSNEADKSHLIDTEARTRQGVERLEAIRADENTSFETRVLIDELIEGAEKAPNPKEVLKAVTVQDMRLVAARKNNGLKSLKTLGRLGRLNGILDQLNVLGPDDVRKDALRQSFEAAIASVAFNAMAAKGIKLEKDAVSTRVYEQNLLIADRVLSALEQKYLEND